MDIDYELGTNEPQKLSLDFQFDRKSSILSYDRL